MNSNSLQNNNADFSLPDHDPGYYYDPQVVAGLHGEIKLSENVEKLCKCGGSQPYQILDMERGEPSWCPCRDYRMKIRLIDRYIVSSGIPARFRYKFKSDFLEHYGDRSPIPGAEQLKHHLNAVLDSHASKPPKGFYLWGNPGCGKTFFSYITLNELIFRFIKPGKFISLSKSFQELRNTFDEESVIHGQADQIPTNLSNVPFLIIDDFGVQRNTEWELEMLYNLIDSRYSNRRLTIVTTNQNINEIKDLAQGRIYSRLLEMCYIIHATARDYREVNNPEDKRIELHR